MVWNYNTKLWFLLTGGSEVIKSPWAFDPKAFGDFFHPRGLNQLSPLDHVLFPKFVILLRPWKPSGRIFLGIQGGKLGFWDLSQF